jgi:ribosomal protein S12 methylthiotransferase accessory factor
MAPIMIDVPALRPQYRTEALERERVVLRSEDGSRVLEGRLCRLVVPLIDGRRSADEIAAKLEGEARPEEVYYTLLRLEQMGLLRPAGERLDSAPAAFWESLGVSESQAADKLRTARIGVVALHGLRTDALVAAARAAGLTIGDDPDLLLVLAHDCTDAALESWNHAALKRRRAWMLVKPAGRIPWLGPIFRPGVTACWSCLSERMRENHASIPLGSAETGLSSGATAVLHLAAVEAAKWIVLGRSELEGAILTLDFGSLGMVRHVVSRRPQCPACGHQSRARRPPRIRFESRAMCLTPGTNHRSCPAEETLARLEPLVSPIAGIAFDLRKTSAPGCPFHSYVASHSAGAGAASRLFRAGGKGATDIDARVSCLAEAAERCSAFHHGDEPLIRSSFKRIRGKAVHPSMLLHFSADQYCCREYWNSVHGAANHVPEPFDESAAIDWTPAWSLSRQAVRYVPAAFTYLGYSETGRQRFCRADSSGCAGGNNLEEAFLQGFFELVERDAAAIWWYNRIRRPAVDLDGWSDPWVAAAASDVHAQRRSLTLLDITHDLEIPCFAAVSWDEQGRSIRFGLGSHLDPKVAARRAVAEMYQALAWPAGEDLDADARSWVEYASLENQPHLVPRIYRSAEDYAALTTSDLAADIETCLAIANRHGLEVLAVELTRPEIGFPVVRVIIPGLRHFWSRFGPGRLYDVPVALGWLERPLSESELNPLLLFR